MDRDAVAAVYAPAARQALESFDVAPAALDLVHMAENVTFRVTARDGKRYVLRLHRPWYHSLDVAESAATQNGESFAWATTAAINSRSPIDHSDDPRIASCVRPPAP